MTNEVTWYKELDQMRQALKGSRENPPYEPKKVPEKPTKEPRKRTTKKVNADD